jgi:WD40 repeat protein
MGNSALSDFAFSPDGRFVVVSACHSDVYDVAGQFRVAQLPSAESCVMGVTWAPDGKTVLTSYETGDVVVWDAASWRVVGRFPRFPGLVRQMQFIDNGQVLSMFVDRMGMLYFNAATQRQVPSPFLIREINPQFWTAFDRFGQGAATAKEYDVSLWRNGRKLRVVRVPSNGTCSAIAADCRLFAHASKDGTIRIWEADGEKPEFVFVADPQPILALAFSPDCRTVAAAIGGSPREGGALKLWNAATGRLLLTLETGLSAVSQLSFSTDGGSLGTSGPNISHKAEVVIWTANHPE